MADPEAKPRSAEIKPAYLITGSDEAKIDDALSRLRMRAEREGGPAALESFDPPGGQAAPDAAALVAALPALSLIGARRYLVADRVEKWGKRQAEQVASALGDAGPDVTVVLVARGKAPAPLAKGVKAHGGEVLAYDAPKARELPAWLVAGARARGFALERDAARLLVERLGPGTARLATELDRLALWAEPEGEVTAADLEEMVTDTSETMVWSLSDAVVEHRAADAVGAAERLSAQGETIGHLVYAMAGRLRRAHSALAGLESGRAPADVAASLDMSPYAAKMLIRSVRRTSLGELRAATGAIADLEWWTRGGAEYGDQTALALAVRRAARARGD